MTTPLLIAIVFILLLIALFLGGILHDAAEADREIERLRQEFDAHKNEEEK